MKTILLGLALLGLAATAGAAVVVSNVPVGTLCLSGSVKPYDGQTVPEGIMAAPGLYSNGVAVVSKPAEWYPQLGAYVILANTLPEALEILSRRNRPAPPQPAAAPAGEVAPPAVSGGGFPLPVFPLPAGHARMTVASPSHARSAPVPGSAGSTPCPPQRPCAQYVVPCGMTQDPGLRAEITAWRNQGVSDPEIQRRLNAQFPAKLAKPAPAACPLTKSARTCPPRVACPVANGPAKPCVNQAKVTPVVPPQPPCPAPAVRCVRTYAAPPGVCYVPPQRVARPAPRVACRRR